MSWLAAHNPWGHRGTAGTSIANELRLVNVSKNYGTHIALKNITLTIKAGEKIALLGASGCGKSTLLRLIAGLEKPKSGALFMDRLEVSNPKYFVPPEERGIGFVFQDYALFPHLTNIGNVKFGLKHLPREEAVSIALTALKRVGLEHRAKDYPENLSGGMQQRVALARAIAPRCGLLLLDEPFSGLDERLRQEVRNETLAVLAETRATCIIVTHDPIEAMQMADRIVLMRNGEIAQVGTANEIYEKPIDLEAARFFSEINEIAATASNGKLISMLGAFDTPLEEGAKAVIALRPQAISLSLQGTGTLGRITSKRFIGENELFEVAIEGRETPLRVKKRAPNPLKTGDTVYINIIRNEALVFATSVD